MLRDSTRNNTSGQRRVPPHRCILLRDFTRCKKSGQTSVSAHRCIVLRDFTRDKKSGQICAPSHLCIFGCATSHEIKPKSFTLGFCSHLLTTMSGNCSALSVLLFALNNAELVHFIRIAVTSAEGAFVGFADRLYTMRQPRAPPRLPWARPAPPAAALPLRARARDGRSDAYLAQDLMCRDSSGFGA